MPARGLHWTNPDDRCRENELLICAMQYACPRFRWARISSESGYGRLLFSGEATEPE
jgi:hypothetical protein